MEGMHHFTTLLNYYGPACKNRQREESGKQHPICSKRMSDQEPSSRNIANGNEWYRQNNEISINMDSRKENQIPIRSSQSQVQSKKQPVPEAASPKRRNEFFCFYLNEIKFCSFSRRIKEKYPVLANNTITHIVNLSILLSIVLMVNSILESGERNLVEYVLTGRIGNISDRRSYQEESYHLGGEESEARVDIKGECWNVISTLGPTQCTVNVPNE